MENEFLNKHYEVRIPSPEEMGTFYPNHKEISSHALRRLKNWTVELLSGPKRYDAILAIEAKELKARTLGILNNVY